MLSPYDHTFVIAAYKKCIFLEDCVKSIYNQKVKGKVFITTSTPNDYIYSIAKKYNFQVVIVENDQSFNANMNFAFSVAKTKLVTICHQDDVYHPDFLLETLKSINSVKDPIFVSTGGLDIDEKGNDCTRKWLNLMKYFLSYCLQFKILNNKKIFKYIPIIFSPALLWASFTYNKEKIQDPLFHNESIQGADWPLWPSYANIQGSIIYNPKKLYFYRIDLPKAESVEAAIDGRYYSFAYSALIQMWPKFMAVQLSKFNTHLAGQKSKRIIKH